MTDEQLHELEASLLDGRYMKMFTRQITKDFKYKYVAVDEPLMSLWEQAFKEDGYKGSPPYNCRPCYARTLANLKARMKSVVV